MGQIRVGRMDYRLFNGIERFGDSTALVAQDGSAISYAELIAMADAAIAPLGPARRLVSIEMANAVEPLALYIGCLRAGHVVIPHDGKTISENLIHTFSPSATYGKTNDEWTLTAHLNARHTLHPHLAILLSTSGSTGSPKLVRLSHQNLSANAKSISEYLDFQPGERAITTLPAHYSYGLSVLHSHLLFGHTLVLNDLSVSEPTFYERVREMEITSLAGVPHSHELLLRSGFFDQDYPALRYLTQAGGKLSADRVHDIANWAKREGKRFYVMYGQAEASPRMAYLPPEDALSHSASIGCAVPGGRFRLDPIKADTDSDNAAGELVYTGPNVMMGYAFGPDDLARGQGSDELKTGDIAVQGSSGYYRIVGRMSRFAKLFGLRISFDEVEQHLIANGIDAAVTGNDSGLDIVTTRRGEHNQITGDLAKYLSIPETQIFVTEAHEIPRLPTGKTDYVAIRNLRAPETPDESQAISQQIAGILGATILTESSTFRSLGGDSLNYVHVAMTLEESFGYEPENWETMPLRELDALPRKVTGHADTQRAKLSLMGLDLARSLAILLALLSHAFTQLGYYPPAEVNIFPRLAMPMLIILFSAMIPLLHMSQIDRSQSIRKNLNKALQCYGLFALNILAIWALNPAGWKYALSCLALVGAAPYTQILVYYGILFLLLPVIVSIFKRFNFWVIFATTCLVHASFLLFKSVPAPPPIGGQPILQRLLDLWVGMGTDPAIAGPSILHSLVLVAAGYWIGMGIKMSSSATHPKAAFLAHQSSLMMIFLAAAVGSFFIPGYAVEFRGLVNMSLRNLNHPAYIFILGLASLVVIQTCLLSSISDKLPRGLSVIGRRSLFAFGIGNVIIVLWPENGLGLFSPIVESLLLFCVVIASIYFYDYAMRMGRNAKGPAAWVHRITTYFDQKTQNIVGVT